MRARSGAARCHAGAARLALPLRRLVRVGVLLMACATTACTQPAWRRGTVQTDTIWSQALGVRKSLVVYLPPSYADLTAKRSYPLVVYLHGGLGNETDWTRDGRLAATMDSLIAAGMQEMIVLMPDGDDGWWTTSHGLNDVAACRRVERKEPADQYCVPWPKYDDYVTHDLLTYADSAYRTLRRRQTRAIAGLSMGGYGAISIAARSPSVFVAAASHSGVLQPALMIDSSQYATTGTVTIRNGRTTDELRTASGTRWPRIAPAFGLDSVSWMARDPAALIERAQRRGETLPAFFVDVGTADHTLTMNRSFRDRMQVLGVPLQYAEGPGAHDWLYWRTHLPESLRFLASHLTP
jgi:putative tributyrin esterase